MPYRKTPLVNGHYYHIFNRGNNKQPIFFSVRDYSRLMELIHFYSYAEYKVRYSIFARYSHERKLEFWNERLNSKPRVEIISFCFMPNHFHFLLKQCVDGGITKYMADIQNGFTKYINTKYNRVGALLQGQFKSVLVEDDKQLLHLTRYIHLNPYTSVIIPDSSELEKYKWSSYPEYISDKNVGNSFCEKDIVLSQFKNKQEYKTFVLDRKDYQRKLEEIKHMIFE